MTATRNRAHLLKEFAESLFSQTSSQWEWIVVDDASTDNTQELVKSYIEKFPGKIKYFRVNQNLGFCHET